MSTEMGEGRKPGISQRTMDKRGILMEFINYYFFLNIEKHNFYYMQKFINNLF